MKNDRKKYILKEFLNELYTGGCVSIDYDDEADNPEILILHCLHRLIRGMESMKGMSSKDSEFNKAMQYLVDNSENNEFDLKEKKK